MFRDNILKLLAQEGIDASQLLEVPPDPKLGDYALPCFILAKERKIAPAKIAQELAGKLSAEFLEKVVAAGPYINFFIHPQSRAKAVLETIHAQHEDYGKQLPKAERVMVEYSQPNTHKAFHIGHVRNTSLGEALSRILRHAGYEVIQANYMGDTGAHIAKWLWHYLKNPEEPPADQQEREKWIASIYVRAVKALAEQPEAEQEVAQILQELDQRTPGRITDIYDRTRQWSIEAFNSIYKDLHAHFDYWFFESEVEERGKEISRELVSRGIATVDDGAIIMDLKDLNLGVWVLLRKDGTALYSAKDLALAERKFEQYAIDRSINVVGAAQSMHFQQLFATLRLMGFPQADKCYHLSYVEVRLPTGKMSSRTGQNILYSDIRQELVEYTTAEVRKRHPDWTDERVERVARQVTVAALKYDMLATDPNKIIVFDPKRATEFEGETGPYLQYTHARACSILAKAGEVQKTQGAMLMHEKEQQLLRTLGGFPEAVERSARQYAPNQMAHYAMALAKEFNTFYHDCPVLSVDDALLRADRLALVAATVTVLGSALRLLAIDAPQEM